MFQSRFNTPSPSPSPGPTLSPAFQPAPRRRRSLLWWRGWNASWASCQLWQRKPHPTIPWPVRLHVLDPAYSRTFRRTRLAQLRSSVSTGSGCFRFIQLEHDEGRPLQLLHCWNKRSRQSRWYAVLSSTGQRGCQFRTPRRNLPLVEPRQMYQPVRHVQLLSRLRC